ncbi:MAG TPA: hypothetical protein PLG87_11640 [Treponemataceae bacterium]|jgi:hypothetical protein|nr:hypothetical protein [Treponemataceae bacterium]
MKAKIGVGRTAEVFDYDDGKVVKLFYETFQMKKSISSIVITK